MATIDVLLHANAPDANHKPNVVQALREVNLVQLNISNKGVQISNPNGVRASH